MTPTQKLEALIEAREKVGKGQWFIDQITTDLTYVVLGDHNNTAQFIYEQDAEFCIQAANFAAIDAKAVLERLRRLEGALRYYADEDTWDNICIDLDYGRDIRRISLTGKARAALAEGT